MSRSFFNLFLFCFLFFNVSVGQKITSYSKGGILYGAPVGPANEGDKGFLRVGPAFGFGVNYSITTSLSIQAELLLSNKKGGYDAVAEGDTVYALEIPNQPPALFPTTYKGRVKGEFDNAYLELPISLNFQFKRSVVNLGGYYGRLISGSHTGDVDLVLGNNFSTIKEKFDDSKYLSKNDLGIVFGGGYYLVKDKIMLGFSGSYGLTSIFTKDYPNVKDKFSNLYMYPYIRINML